jgi:(p)ppGpp synthase/HD superfamily hydrolase
MMYSRRVRDALRFAVEHHGDRLRKGSIGPYHLHPIAVATMLVASGAPEDVVVAGYLHDLVEDEDVTLDDVERLFGADVRRLVDAVTERKLSPTGARRPWRERKEEAIDHLADAPLDVLALKGADLCANIGDVVMDHAVVGTAVWGRFGAGRDEQVWYYTTAAAAVLTRLTGYGRLRTDLARRVGELAALA